MAAPIQNDAASALDPNALQKVRFEAKQGSPDALRKTAQEFEALLLNTMLKTMRDAGPKGGIFDTNEQRMFIGMFDQQVAHDMARAGGIGLADALLRQLEGARGLAEALKDGPPPPLTR